MFIFIKRFYRDNRNGFTLIEVLFSLSITMIIMLSLTSLYSLISHSQRISDYAEDIYIGAKQASQYVIGTSYVSVGKDYRYLDYEGKEMSLEFDNHRLVKKEGYEILIHNLDKVSFQIRNKGIYMKVTRDGQKYNFLLTYAREVPEINEDEEAE